MSNRYTTNKNAIADCDVCGFQFKLRELKDLYVRKTNTNIKACKECWNPDQPQNKGVLEPRSTTEYAGDVSSRRSSSSARSKT
jgi:hypothetical protein